MQANHTIIQAPNDVIAFESCLFSLPQDLLIYFFEKFLEIRDISFLDMAICNRLQRTIFLSTLQNFIAPSKYSCTESYLKNLETDTTYYMKWISNRNITIKQLYINNWSEYILNYLNIIYLNNKHLKLESLKFNFKRERFINFNEENLLEVINTTNFKNLTNLSLQLNNIISDTSLFAIANQYTRLKSINLCNCDNISENGLIEIAKKCSLLEVIELAWIKNISNFCLLEMSKHCTNLKNINLSNCRIQDNGLIEIIKSSPKLEILCIQYNNITDQSLIAMSMNCLSLKKLDLGNCGNITDFGVIAIAERCVKILTLAFGFNNILTDKSFNAISIYLLSLESLFLVDCRNITDDGIIAISKKCLKLKHLSLFHNNNFTNMSLHAISVNSSNIETLSLNNCEHITDIGVVLIAEKCLKLTELRLRKINITNVSLFAISRHCKNLKILYLDDCRKITTEGSIAVETKCMKLKALSIF